MKLELSRFNESGILINEAVTVVSRLAAFAGFAADGMAVLDPDGVDAHALFRIVEDMAKRAEDHLGAAELNLTRLLIDLDPYEGRTLCSEAPEELSEARLLDLLEAARGQKLAGLRALARAVRAMGARAVLLNHSEAEDWFTFALEGDAGCTFTVSGWLLRTAMEGLGEKVEAGDLKNLPAVPAMAGRFLWYVAENCGAGASGRYPEPPPLLLEAVEGGVLRVSAGRWREAAGGRSGSTQQEALQPAPSPARPVQPGSLDTTV